MVRFLVHGVFLFVLFLELQADGSNRSFENMQHRLDQMEILLKKQMTAYDHQESVINHQASTIKELQTTIRNMNKHTDLSHVLKRQSTDRVAFSARLTTDRPNLGVHHTIVYNSVVTDITSSYNGADGIFTVPVTGYYVFTWTSTVRYGQYLKSEIDVNGKIHASLVVDCDTDADRGTGAQTVILRVNRGEHIFIRTVTGGDTLKGENGDSFSGWLLYSEE